MSVSYTLHIATVAEGHTVPAVVLKWYRSPSIATKAIPCKSLTTETSFVCYRYMHHSCHAWSSRCMAEAWPWPLRAFNCLCNVLWSGFHILTKLRVSNTRMRYLYRLLVWMILTKYLAFSACLCAFDGNGCLLKQILLIVYGCYLYWCHLHLNTRFLRGYAENRLVWLEQSITRKSVMLFLNRLHISYIRQRQNQRCLGYW